MLDNQQSTPEEIAQRLHQMDIRLNQCYPGYLEQLALIREPQVTQERTWHKRECSYGSDNSERQHP